MTTILRINSQLIALRDDLEDSGNLMSDWLRGDERSEDIADVAALMARVGSHLQNCINTFLEGWDFTEDCRRGREKEAAGAESEASA